MPPPLTHHSHPPALPSLMLLPAVVWWAEVEVVVVCGWLRPVLESGGVVVAIERGGECLVGEGGRR